VTLRGLQGPLWACERATVVGRIPTLLKVHELGSHPVFEVTTKARINLLKRTTTLTHELKAIRYECSGLSIGISNVNDETHLSERFSRFIPECCSAQPIRQ
jgi:hypothetical protein